MIKFKSLLACLTLWSSILTVSLVTATIINLIREIYALTLNHWQLYYYYKEISKSSSILYQRASGNQNYSVLEFLFDTFHIPVNLKKNLLLFCATSFLALPTIIILAPAPIIFVLFYQKRLWLRAGGWFLKMKLLRKSGEISFDINFPNKGEFPKITKIGWYHLWTEMLKYPQIWADLSFYSILSFKNNKLPVKSFDASTLSWILGRPLWIVKTSIFWAAEILTICGLSELRRKRLHARPRIIIRKLQDEIYLNFNRKNTTLYTSLNFCKIIFTDGKFALNPNDWEKLILLSKRLEIWTRPTTFKTFMAKGQPHLFITEASLQTGVALTTAKTISGSNDLDDQDYEIKPHFINCENKAPHPTFCPYASHGGWYTSRCNSK